MGFRVSRKFETPEKRKNARKATVDFQSQHPNTFPIFGTLLGIVREGDVINHDSDVDFGCFEFPTISTDIIGDPCNYSRSFHHSGEESERVYRHTNGTKIDLFLFFRDGDSAYCTIYPDEFDPMPTIIKRYPVRMVSGTEQKAMWGGHLWILDSAEQYLEATYGPNWREPDPEFSHR